MSIRPDLLADIEMQTKKLWLLLIAAGSLAGCTGKSPEPEQSAHAAELEIGRLATGSATAFVQAMRECKIVGIPDLDKCADNQGILGSERIASMLALEARSETRHYFSTCVPKKDANYCNNLMERATKIEWRRPPTIDDDSSVDDDPHDD